MNIKDIIQIIANFAVVGALLFSGISVSQSKKEFQAQKQSQQAILFNELKGRIFEVYDQQKDYKEDNDSILYWYVTLFNAFESFAFFANNDYLSPEMIEYCKGTIDDYYNFANDTKNVKDYLVDLRKKGQLEEVAKYYKNVIGKDPPF